MHNRSSHRATGRSSVADIIPYLLVLAGVAAGLVVAGEGSKYAGRGAVVAGGSLLVAALARLVLPKRRAGLLASRSKAFDVLTFVVLGGGMLALGLVLPQPGY
jgi:hypothetical protein